MVFTALRGLNSADPATTLRDHEAVDMHNVLAEPGALGRRRPSLTTLSLSSGPSAEVWQLIRYQPAASSSAAELWAFSGTNTCHRYASSAWASVSLSDTVAAVATSRPYGATLNGKLFLAYNSDQNRLHVWDGTSVRRVGIAASAVPTMADTGSGSYANTIRYYKVQFKIKSGTNVVATSELSASDDFTPSGSGTHARVTKPTTPDSATHWVVFGSSDNVTFYDVSGDLAVGTTTYDDNAAPSAYSSGTVEPTAGLSVPPPAAKYLLSTDNRLFMAGCWETSAAATETGTRNSRVWFTQVLGARDNTGEDESIVQTTDLKYWVDVGENDGDAITGLGGAVDGVVYAFKSRSVWRLSPTGNASVPYRAACLSRSLGATWQDAIAMGEDGAGSPAVYFLSQTGPKRITSGYGIEDLGGDVRQPYGATFSAISAESIACWDAVRRVAWWFALSSSSAYAFQPQFEERTREGVRGGWTRHTMSEANNAVTVYEAASNLVPFVGGSTTEGSTPVIASLSGSSRMDASADTFTPSVTSRVYQPGGPLSRSGFGHVVLEWQYPGAATAPTVSVSSAIGGPLAVLGTVTDTATSSTYTTTVVQEKLESIQLSDVFGFQITVTWDESVDGTTRPRIHGVTIPVTLQEGA